MTSNTTRQFGITLPSGVANINSIVTEDGNTFFNATELWKLAGKDKSQQPAYYLRSEKAQEYIRCRWQALNNTGDSSVDTIATLDFTPNKALPAEVTAPFVITTRGRGAATYFDYNVFVDYAQYLSAEFKDTLIETFKVYGFIYNAPINERTELLVQEAQRAEQQVLEKAIGSDFDQLSREEQLEFLAWRMARVDSKVSTANLKEIIAVAYAATQSQMGDVYTSVFGSMLSVILGLTSKELAEKLGAGKWNRDFLSPTALRAFTYAQSNFIQELEDCIEDGELPEIKALPGIMGKFAKEAREKFIFKNGRRNKRLVARNRKERGSKDYGPRGIYTLEITNERETLTAYKAFS